MTSHYATYGNSVATLKRTKRNYPKLLIRYKVTRYEMSTIEISSVCEGNTFYINIADGAPGAYLERRLLKSVCLGTHRYPLRFGAHAPRLLSARTFISIGHNGRGFCPQSTVIQPAVAVA